MPILPLNRHNKLQMQSSYVLLTIECVSIQENTNSQQFSLQQNYLSLLHRSDQERHAEKQVLKNKMLRIIGITREEVQVRYNIKDVSSFLKRTCIIPNLHLPDPDHEGSLWKNLEAHLPACIRKFTPNWQHWLTLFNSLI